jgi:tRNA-dihydrouridine synthase B
MIGRGCYGRPWFADQVARYIRTGARQAEPPLSQQKSIVQGHYHAMLSQFGLDAGVRLARKHLAWYSRGLPGSAEYRAAMNRLSDAAAVLRLMDQFYDPLIERGVARHSVARDEALLAA